MNERGRSTTEPADAVWPPPPTSASLSVQAKNRLQWFRPAFWLGIGFNLLACFPAIKLLKHIDGAIFWGEDTNLAPFLMPVSVLAVGVGIPMTVWQIRKRLKQKQFVVWEVIGLLLCACSYFTGTAAFLGLLQLLNVDVQGHE